MPSELPGVSVVIPTIGRPELQRAIDSVRRQDYAGPIELIVVADLAQGTLTPGQLSGVDKLLHTGGGRRGGAARNLGVQHASMPFVAFLDDDDEFASSKLTVQMPVFADPTVDVVAGRGVYRNPRTDSVSSPVPTHLMVQGQSATEYLFRRRIPSVGRAVLYTSTLVARAELAREVVWDETLPRHQDWDWVDRLERGGARFAHVGDTTAVIWTGTEGSISSSADWKSSLDWALEREGVWDANLLADFLAAHTLRYALQAGSWAGVRGTLRAIAATRRVPSFSTLVLGMAGVVPRTFLNKALSRFKSGM